MKLAYILTVGIGAMLAMMSTPAVSAIVSLQCKFSQSLVGDGYAPNFPQALNIWIHTGRSVADVQRDLTGYGWDTAPSGPYPVRISAGFYQVDLGNGSFAISISINRMTGVGQYYNSVMLTLPNYAPMDGNYVCAKSDAPLPTGKF